MASRVDRQRGLTLTELMVSVAISLVVLVALDKVYLGEKARKARAASSTTAPARSSSDAVSLATLLAAKKLAGSLGGVAQAKAALDALAKLGL